MLTQYYGPIISNLRVLRLISCELPCDIRRILTNCNQLEEIYIKQCYGNFLYTREPPADPTAISRINNFNLKKLILTDNVSCRSNSILPIIDSYAPNLTHFAFTELTLPINIALNRIVKLDHLETFTVDLMGIPVSYLSPIMSTLKLKQLHLIKGGFLDTDMSMFRNLNELRLDFAFDINTNQIKELLFNSQIQILFLPPNLQLNINNILGLLPISLNLTVLRFQLKHGIKITNTEVDNLLKAKPNNKKVTLEIMSDMGALFFNQDKLNNTSLNILPLCTPIYRMRKDFLERERQL